MEVREKVKEHEGKRENETLTGWSKWLTDEDDEDQEELLGLLKRAPLFNLGDYFIKYNNTNNYFFKHYVLIIFQTCTCNMYRGGGW